MSDPTRLSVDELQAVLITGGATDATVTQINEDIAAGCPVNPDGTLHLVHYGAWLAQQRNRPVGS